MSHIKTIDFAQAEAISGAPTKLLIDYAADADGEKVTLEVLANGVTISPSSVTVSKGSHVRSVSVTLTRGTCADKTVSVEATIMIDADHGSSAFDNIDLV